MKKILVLISVLCIIFVLGTVTAFADNTLFTFENDSDFSKVSVEANAGKIELAKDPGDASNNCVHIVDNSTGALSNAGFVFEDSITTSVEVSFRVKFSSYGVYSIVLLNNTTNTAMVSFIGREDGKLYTYNGSTQMEICNYELNKWYNVKIVADVTNNKFDLTVNDINIKSYKFRNASSSLTTFRAGTVAASKGDFYIDDVSVPYREIVKIPLTTATAIEKKSLVTADDGKTKLNYFAFPMLAEVEENKIAVAYKRGSAHLNDPSDLEVTYIDKTTAQIISRQTVESSTEVCYQNPDLVTMPNGDTYCYTDVQKPGIGRIGVTVHKYNKDTDKWDFVDDQLYDDKGIQYGYTFDGIIHGNRLYMLAMAFPTLENQGYGRSVHIIYTDDNGITWKHLTSLTDEIDYLINESGFIMYEDEILVISRGDDSTIHMYRVDKNGKLVKYNNVTAMYTNIWQAARPKLFTYNGKHYFSTRSFPDRNNQNYQEYTVFEYDPETLEVLEGQVLDTRNGSMGDAYYGEHYISEKDGKQYVHFIVHATKHTEKPSIDDYVFDFEDLFGSGYDIIVDDNIVNVSKEKNDGMIIFAYYKDEKFVKTNIYLPANVKDFEVQKSDEYNRVKIMWWSDDVVALCAAEAIEFKNKESLLVGKNISILGDSISSYAGYSNDTSVNNYARLSFR